MENLKIIKKEHLAKAAGVSYYRIDKAFNSGDFSIFSKEEKEKISGVVGGISKGLDEKLLTDE